MEKQEPERFAKDILTTTDDLETRAPEGSGRTCSLTKPAGEPRESESAAEMGDLAALAVNGPESRAAGSEIATRSQKGRNVRQLRRLDGRKKTRWLVCQRSKLPAPNAIRTARSYR